MLLALALLGNVLFGAPILRAPQLTTAAALSVEVALPLTLVLALHRSLFIALFSTFLAASTLRGVLRSPLPLASLVGSLSPCRLDLCHLGRQRLLPVLLLWMGPSIFI